MLVKIFNRGKGRGEGPVGYLLGEKFLDGGDIRAGAKVLSGDAFITKELINSSNFSKRYTSGVLSFEERPDQLSEQDKKKIMQDFEQSMFPGMNPDRVNFLWVEHTDKENPKTGEPRLELNFVIPNTEIYTGKRLQPYYHLQDAKYFRAWQTLTNDRFALSDPDDPTQFRKVNPFDSNQNPKKTAQDLKQEIETFLTYQLDYGLIENRDDVIWQLENNPYVDIKVTRRSPKFISVVGKDNQKPIRLKGFLFEEDFSYREYQSRQVEATADTPNPTKKIETAQSKGERVEKARSDFIAIYEHKKNQNLKKYHIPNEEAAWVAKHFAPFDLLQHPSQQNIPELAQQVDAKSTQLHTQPTITKTLQDNQTAIANPENVSQKPTPIQNAFETPKPVTENSSPFEVSLEDLQRAHAKKKANAEAEKQAEGKRLLELQAHLQQQKLREEKLATERNRRAHFDEQLGQAIDYCSHLGREGYDLGLDKIMALFKEHLTQTTNQKEGSYFETVRLGIGRFADKFHVTKDGRLGVDYSPYINVRSFTFFHSSEVFEIKQDKLYFRGTQTFYPLNQFSDKEKAILTASVANSEQNLQQRLAQPSGLAGAYLTYAAEVKELPKLNATQPDVKQGQISDYLKDAFVTYRSDLDDSSPSNGDDEGLGF